MRFWRSSLAKSSLLLAIAWLGGEACVASEAVGNATTPGSEYCHIDRADDVWLISTRHLGCPSWDKSDQVDLVVKHYGGKGNGWDESSVDELLRNLDPSQPVLIYVHGNQIDRNAAIRRARNLRNTVLGCTQIEPIRLVIWSWPSDKVHGCVRDARVKAARTNGEGYYLAWFLSQLDPATPLQIVGYSFGARVTTGALHVLGGGELAGRKLPAGESARSYQVRVALLAAALDRAWLRSGSCHGSALSQMSRLLIQYNSCDPALQRYRFIEKHARPVALGYTGMYIDDSQATWIEQRNVCCIVGKSHAEARYTSSTTLTDQIRETLFGEQEVTR